MSVIANLFSAAMYAFVLQNLIFTGGYGASEAVRMAAKPKQLFPLTAFYHILFDIRQYFLCTA